MSDCISDLILEAREKRCKSSSVEKHPLVLEVLTKKLAVVINEIGESVKLASGENVFSIEEKFALIDYGNCNPMSAEKQIMSGKWESKLSDPLSDAQALVKIEEFTTDKRIRALREEVIKDIEEMKNFKSSMPDKESFLEKTRAKIISVFQEMNLWVKIGIPSGALFCMMLAIYACLRKSSRGSYENEIIELTARRLP